jgi:phosphoenolpyruvate carboxykinase (GTP)
MTSTLPALQDWVDEVAALTQPENIHWCDGSEAEYRQLVDEMCESGTLMPLNEDAYPNCYLHRSDPSDVARVEHLTFICTTNEEDAGPNNLWMNPAEAHKKIDALFEGAMKGRTMYVIPYCMGPIKSPYSRMGVEITDSPYVVANMKIMTRMGSDALKRIEKEGTFVKGLHSTGDLDPERRFIMHFPEELSIKSIGSGYGGNALLGKKCHALRIASWQARTEGWLAEHMLIVGVENPDGAVHYIACAFPSACGKTNLAMLVPPDSHQGWKIWTLGDDIAWLHTDEGGKLRAINPEAGYFGVVPGTNVKTNRSAFEMIMSDTIFTNVAVTDDNEPWWEDKKAGVPAIDWQGRKYDPSNGPAAHPNSRFTVSATQNPNYSTLADAPGGVPISAVIFGGRRKELAPLVYQARNWRHGVLIVTGRTGCHLGDRPTTCRKSSTSTGSARTRKAISCGPALARICACCAGSSTAVTTRLARKRHRSAICRTTAISLWRAWMSRRKRWAHCSRSTSSSGRKSLIQSVNTWTDTGIACRTSCARNIGASPMLSIKPNDHRAPTVGAALAANQFRVIRG